ncbi:MAG: hypothetical protein OXE44_05595 [Nitrospinae bacterium]|nr:hypothetical protein [Nitrospinota bacterium]
MNSWKQGVSNFAKTRRALLAGLLGLGLAVLWSGVVFATTIVNGPRVIIDSATDDGGGKIRISWSLQSEPENVTFRKDLPEKVCVFWAVVEDGVEGSYTDTCFTSEVASQDDLVVDTGIGGDGPKTVYSLVPVPYYYGLPTFPADENGNQLTTEVTLNASA